jgi:fluoroacetyl-CoA thioesterase
MDFLIPLNISAARTLLVEKAHSAREIGSGDMDVLATPMLIALMEAAALAAVQTYLAAGWSTVGTRVDVEHLRATPLGGKVTAEATLMKRDNRLLEFAVEAHDSFGLVGQGKHQRFIINQDKFLKKIQGKA